MAQFNLTTASNLFKIKYGKLSENTYNSANVLLGRVKKDFNFTGKRMDIAVPTSFAGGVGSGSLPTPNYAAVQDAVITSKKMYSVIQIDREAIKASSQNEGAFVELTKYSVQKGVESWMRNMSRALFNDGSGSLGTIAAGGVSGAGPWDVVISDATWKEANFEEKDYVNLASSSAVFEITAVVPATKTVTLTAVSGSYTPLAGDVIYMQNSKLNDPSGLKGVLDATSGSLYGITVGQVLRWLLLVQVLRLTS
jgi:hypothetical protein